MHEEICMTKMQLHFLRLLYEVRGAATGNDTLGPESRETEI